jgi:phosphate transport system protein
MKTMRRRRDRSDSEPPAPPNLVDEAVPPVDLREIDLGVRSMFASMPDRLAAAGAAFLHGDRDAARRVVETDPAIDALQEDIEALVQVELARQPLPPDELRYLITVLRIVPELERSADLVEHIALRAQHALSDRLSARARSLVEQMTGTAVIMWREAGEAFERREASAVGGLRARDDQLDDLHVRLTGELATERLDPSVAIELGLVARFFERLGDHAVNVVGRLAYISDDAAGRR